MFTIGDVLGKLQAAYEVTEPLTPEEYDKQKVQWFNEAEGNLNEEDGYNCEICRNKGVVARVGEGGGEVCAPCKCQKIRATLNRARRSGLGDIITEYTFDKFETAEDWQKGVKSTAQAFCTDEAAKWFFIGGQVGSGKTHICTAIAAHYIKAGQEVKYMIWAEEAKKLKALVNDESYTAEIAIYKNVDVLYIDDFLKVKNGEDPTAGDINLAFEIINRRLIDRNKITIISSEKTLNEIIDYDEATMSRIAKEAGKYKINIGKDRNKNYRLRGGIVC